MSLFYDRYAQLVYRLARRVLDREEEAEEVVQDVFLQVWHQASRYDATRSAPRTWLMTLARSRAIDRLRSTRHRTQSLETLSAEGPSLLIRSGERSGDPFLEDTVRQALAALSPEERQPIELAYYYGFTQSQIAERLSLPLGTVKTRMRQGLKRLKELLAPLAKL